MANVATFCMIVAFAPHLTGGQTLTTIRKDTSMKAAISIPQLSDHDKKRFQANVKKRPGEECWEWQKGQHSFGYGVFIVLGHGKFYAHRIAWFLEFGSDPGDMRVCHKCDNPKCCRPDHLFLGTDGDNLRDMFAKGRGYIKKGNSLFIGTKNPRAKITEEDVREIRRLHKVGNLTNPQIGERFGIAGATVSNIARANGTWRHIV